MTETEREQMKAWVENWKRVGPILEEFRRQELRELTWERGRMAADSLLQLSAQFARTRDASGMVEMQRIFQKARR